MAARKLANKDGVEMRSVFLEVTVPVHQALRIVAAEEDVRLIGLLRNIIDQFLATRKPAQQSSPLETSNGEGE